jgi:hypothetical protein
MTETESWDSFGLEGGSDQEVKELSSELDFDFDSSWESDQPVTDSSSDEETIPAVDDFESDENHGKGR